MITLLFLHPSMTDELMKPISQEELESWDNEPLEEEEEGYTD